MNDNDRTELEKTLRRMSKTKGYEVIGLTGYHAKLILKYIDELKGSAEHEQVNDNRKPDS